ncbi:MAG: transposase [bacterium]|nr:transposase [bacterium]
MPAAACHQPATTPAARAYRRRRPAATLLHELVRTHLETWLATAAERDEYGRGVALHVESELRGYLKCGILAHGFARVYCGNCRHDFLVAFSCKGRDLCPSCATRRMVDVSAHMVDQVLPRVQHRQWVLSVPKRVRWHLRHKPEVISGLLTVFLRAVETTLRQCSPGAPADARFGAVAFVHRFGSYLNSHVHFHVLVTDGVFSAGPDGEAIFHPALDLERKDFEAVQTKMRHRGLRWLHRHGHLDDDALHVLDSSDHAGGWSVDASVTIPGWDRHGLERLARYCARPPLSQERLGRLNEQTLVYSLRRPTADGRTELQLTPIELLDRLAQLVTPPRLHKHRYCGVLAPNAALRAAVTASAGPAGATLQLLEQARASMGLPSVSPPASDPPSPLSNLRRAAARCWALLLVRIYECLPLRCPECGEAMRIIAFLLDRPVIERILEHIGEPTQPPAVLPARSPPQLEFGFDQTIATDDWPEMDQTAGRGAGGWE